MMWNRLFMLLVAAVLQCTLNGVVVGQEEGELFASGSMPKTHDSVQALDISNFDSALRDPLNSFWLLKFYAPWCGHCKQLAPVLEKIAPVIKGKMAIGTIDCTADTGKALCKRFNVRGYPTLMVHRDGSFFPYPGSRKADDIISFAEKMSQPPVKIIRTREDLESFVSKSYNGVVFLAYDPIGAGIANNPDNVQSTLELQIMQSTNFLKTLKTVARKAQHSTEFGLLTDPEIVPRATRSDPEYFVKYENDAPLVECAFTPEEKTKAETSNVDKWTMSKIHLFVTQNSLPLVSHLSRKNFRTVGNMGKPLAIGIQKNGKDEAEKATLLGELKEMALLHKEKYIFGWTTGADGARFFSQFNLGTDEKFVVVNVSKKQYWKLPEEGDSPKTLKELMRAMEADELKVMHIKGRKDSLVTDVYYLFMDAMPFSLAILFGLFIVIAAIIYVCRFDRSANTPAAPSSTDAAETAKKND